MTSSALNIFDELNELIVGDGSSWTGELARPNDPIRSPTTQPGDMPDWLIMLQRKVYPLMRLPVGWDSYNGLPVRLDTASFTLNFLQDMMDEHTPMPSVVPTSNGGIQLEWHERGIDLEVHISEPYETEYYFLDHNNGSEDEGELRGDFTVLRVPIDLLTARG